MNLPNKLTILRMVMVPFFIACFYLPFEGWNYIAAGVFIVAYLTDILDGNIARKRNLVTDFGKLMDPIADKLLTSSALIMLTAESEISPIVTIIVIGREFVISGCRLIWAGNGVVVAAGSLGKLKTVTQCVAIALILLRNPLFSLINVRFDLILLYASTAICVWSAVDYILKNRKAMRDTQGTAK